MRLAYRLEQTGIRRVPGGEQERCLGAGEGRELLLELFEDFVMAAQKPRATRPCGDLDERRTHRVDERRVFGEPEIIVGDEVDALGSAQLTKKPFAAKFLQRRREPVFKVLARAHAR
jgi:hypothetical protein